MVSLPLRYFTYSAWTSRRSKAAPITALAATHRAVPPITARYRPLRSITHPPDPIPLVVSDQQCAVRRHDDPDRTPPARAVDKLPAGDEVLDRGRPPVLHPDAHERRARWHGTVPGAVIRHEGIALVVGGELRPRVEREPERRGMGLHRQRRRLDPGAVEARVFGVRLVGQIALRPAVPLPVPQDVEVLGRQVVRHCLGRPNVVAVVVVGPKLDRKSTRLNSSH